MNESLWQQLQQIPREDWPQFIKKNHPNLWLKLAWTKVNEWRDNQQNQAKVLGDTPDYSRELFTLDDRATKMVNYAFQKYWEDGLVYKGAYLVNWSVGLMTAVSDVAGEIEYEKRTDPFVTFEYEIKELKVKREELKMKFKTLVSDYLKPLSEFPRLRLSTVRPETKFTDLAVAMHPTKFEIYFNKDLFYTQKEGFNSDLAKEFIQAIENYEIEAHYHLPALKSGSLKLILSEKIDPNFGTGILKVTPAHDQFDYDLYKEFVEKGILEAGKVQTSIGRDGKLTEVCGEFAGLTVEQGRLAVIKRLAETGYIPVKVEFKNESVEILAEVKNNLESESFDATVYSYAEGQKRLQEILGEAGKKLAIDWNYEHNVSICERSKTVIEPLISEEFFLSYQTPAKSTGKTLQQHGFEGVSEVQFFSSDYQERANNFIENIHDWCISRDLVWGHKIPVWYNLDVNPERRLYSKNELEKFVTEKEIDPIKIQPTKPTEPGNWVQETKIFDTWFSSTLWPLSTLDFVEYKAKEEKLFVIHGGDSFQTESEYLEFIKGWNLSPQDYLDIDSNWGSWKKDLQKTFKNSHIKVIYPSFPDKLNAKYEAWKIWFEKILVQTGSNNLSLVGHSLGGNFLLKYLSENDLQVKNLYLVASCQNIGDFKTGKDFSLIQKNCENITIYHSKDDQVVPFSVAQEIASKLPKAKLVEFENRGHFVEAEFVELKSQISADLRVENKTDFEKFYPTQEMTTAKEIFYIWIVRMIILGKYFTGKIPFEKVIITPTILDEKGRKMSKSLGNGLDPVVAIDQFSSDSLRLAMLGGMIPNRNMKMGGKLAENIMQKYRNFGNKIWNVARFLEGKEGEKKQDFDIK
jgi:valyl-tRNA synthetase/predicted alpha/beta hydrolase family esterase